MSLSRRELLDIRLRLGLRFWPAQGLVAEEAEQDGTKPQPVALAREKSTT